MRLRRDCRPIRGNGLGRWRCVANRWHLAVMISGGRSGSVFNIRASLHRRNLIHAQGTTLTAAEVLDSD